MKKIVSGLVAGCIALLSVSTATAGETLTVRADVWPPFNGNPASTDQPGYGVEVLKAIFEPQGFAIDYQTLPWTRTIKEVTQGKYDMAIGGSKDDTPACLFPEESIGVMENVFYVKKGSAWKFEGIASLKNIKLGCVADYSYDGGEIDAYIKGATEPAVQAVTGDDALKRNVQKLQAGRIDVVIDCRVVMTWTLKDMKIAEDEIVAAGSPGKPSDLFVVFSPAKESSKKNVQLFTEGLRKLRADGSLLKILSKYGLKDWKTAQ